ncbi:glycoside hydrolase family 9 protein [Leptothoe spongobia]|uniref:Endoglucanase n=1 Tax=Leptothoe spongobia TAU-MAC 1115 TaxID=1967444 RepID=A0A947DHH2_9CYAN|nr:glycoside hydrolase family 9 protein [Leptothoe spongobia]MBT9317030.1 glycoside hydrolase family 9 protein [Leptothoe spongobia TAU-MAC 1115]
MQTTFRVSEDWGNGLVGFVTVENGDDKVLTQWDLTIDTTFDIETIWGVDIVQREGNRYTLAPKSWNASLEPGDVAKFGFVGRNATAKRHQLVVIPDSMAYGSTPLADSLEQVQAPIESVDFDVAGQWGHAFVGDLSFTYNGIAPIDSWELQFESSFPILRAWHGEIISQSGNVYTIRNTRWNGTLLPGDTITIRVKAAGTFVDPPTNYVFNGDFVVNVPGEPIILDLPQEPELPTIPEIVEPVEQPADESDADDLPVEPPVVEPSSPEEPIAEEPVMEDPAVEESPVEEPVAEQPPIEEPVAEQPSVEKPVVEPPTVEAPVIEEPPAEAPVAEQPSPGQPALEQPVVEKPVTEQPSLENPVVELSPEKSAPVASGTEGSLYGEALQKSLLFYEAQRSGALPKDNRIAWRSDSALNDGADVGVDLTGGYYDAGDHVKFGLPMASSLTLLSWGAIEYRAGYQTSGQYDELQAAIKWGTDYLLKAHISDGQTTQALYGQVGDPNTDHAYWGPPEDLAIARPAYKIDVENPGSDLAAETAAALASASIVFRDTNPAYADELLANAKQLYAFADTYRGRYSDSIPQARKYYDSWSGYTDELAWGAAWLYQATREQQYLEQAQQNYRNLGVDWTHNWDDKSYGTGVLLAQITDEHLYRSEVETWLNHWVSGSVSTTEGGLAWLDQWGSLRYSANTALLAGIYSDTVNSAQGQYDDFSRSQIDYILGDNPAQRSYVAGIGNNFPEYIHHRAASGTNDIHDTAPNQYVLYGALVGGPTSFNDFSYIDNRNDFLGNEVALDFNAGFTGAIARLYNQHGGELLSDDALIALSTIGLSEIA